MSRKFVCVAAIIATAGLFLNATEVQAQGYRYYSQGSGPYGQSTQFYGSSNRGPLYSNGLYGARTYAPNAVYSVGPGINPGYQYSNQFRYSNGNRYWGGNRSLSGSSFNGFAPRSGFSLGFGSSRFGNRGFGLGRRF